MRTLKNHRRHLLTVFALAQLAILLCVPVTRETASLLVRAVVSGHYVLYMLLAPCLLAFGVVFNRRLKALDWRWLEWSPFHVRSNLALLPLKNRWLGVPYGLMLAACMPLLALLEEMIFRSGTQNWVRGALWGALAFGVFHLASFVSVRMVIYLTLVGAILVQVYMFDGLIAVFVVHACYNLLTLTLVIAEQRLKRAPSVLRRASARVAAAI